MSQLINNLPYHDIILTDVTLHAQKSRKPLPWYRAMMKSFRNGKPGSVYSNNSRIWRDKDGKYKISIPFSQSMQEAIAEAKKTGKQVRILVPKDGLLLLAGKDLIEYMDAHPELLKDIERKLPT